MLLKTDRLYLREISFADLNFISDLHADPDVMRFIGAPRTTEETQKKLNQICQYYTANPGYGVWLACQIDTEDPIGWACLKDLDGTPEKEIGYRLAKNHWGNGYATEVSRALIEYGFKHKKLAKIVGVTHPDNLGSQRVLEKVGLQYVKDAYFYNCSVRYYHLDRAQWHINQYQKE